MNINKLNGLILFSVDQLEEESDIVWFNTNQGRYCMQHYQDCCEYVRVIDFEDDIDYDGEVIVVDAYESSSDAEDVSESGTWTFYHINTNKGSIYIRWLGESNGYYSESVEFNKEGA